jgi:hypothetical protein
MKATLDFDLNDPDDRRDHKRCVKASDMASALWEFARNSKKTLISQVEECLKVDKTFSHYDVLDLVFNIFDEICNEEDINIDNLVE